MKHFFKKAAVSGLLAATVLAGASGGVFADVSYYNGTAVRKPGERRVADAAFVAKNCWRPLTDEGAGRYPQAVAALSAHANETVMGQELLAQVKKSDIAFCPPSAMKAEGLVTLDVERRLITVAANAEDELAAVSFRTASAYAVLSSDKSRSLLETASTEKKIRHQIYNAAAAATPVIVQALEEKENGRPAAWDEILKIYGASQEVSAVSYSDVKTAGGSHQESLLAAGSAAFTALLKDDMWLKAQISDVLIRTNAELESGALKNRPIDEADEKLEGLFKHVSRLTADMNFVAGIKAPSKEALFQGNPDLLWEMQWIDVLRSASSYGINNSRVDRVLEEMQATQNPYLKKLMGPN